MFASASSSIVKILLSQTIKRELFGRDVVGKERRCIVTALSLRGKGFQKVYKDLSNINRSLASWGKVCPHLVKQMENCVVI